MKYRATKGNKVVGQVLLWWRLDPLLVEHGLEGGGLVFLVVRGTHDGIIEKERGSGRCGREVV